MASFFYIYLTCSQSINSVNALSLAAGQGQKIYIITAQNAPTALPALPVTGQVGNEIRNAIQAGKEVTIHEKPINAHGWTGYAYIIVDPETGAGAYEIEGGGNGGVVNPGSLFIAGVGYFSVGVLMLFVAPFSALLAAMIISLGMHIILL